MLGACVLLIFMVSTLSFIFILLHLILVNFLFHCIWFALELFFIALHLISLNFIWLHFICILIVFYCISRFFKHIESC